MTKVRDLNRSQRMLGIVLWIALFLVLLMFGWR